MTEMLPFFAFAAGAFFTGAATTVKAFTSFAARYAIDQSEDCLGNFVAASLFAIAMYFFYLFLINL